MDIQLIAFWLNELIFPLVGLVLAIGSLIIFTRSQQFSLKAGSINISAINKEESEIRERIDEQLNKADPSERQFTLLKEYHAQGLAQSKVSFYFSLTFASLGFLIIVFSIMSYLGASRNPVEGANTESYNIVSQSSQPIFALIAGTVVEAVAALFFVQSNKARQLMSDFFDKARKDRKLDESLVLASQIEDDNVKTRLRAYLSLCLAESEPDQAVMESILSGERPSPPRPHS